MRWTNSPLRFCDRWLFRRICWTNRTIPRTQGIALEWSWMAAEVATWPRAQSRSASNAFVNILRNTFRNATAVSRATTTSSSRTAFPTASRCAELNRSFHYLKLIIWKQSSSLAMFWHARTDCQALKQKIIFLVKNIKRIETFCNLIAWIYFFLIIISMKNCFVRIVYILHISIY